MTSKGAIVVPKYYAIVRDQNSPTIQIQPSILHYWDSTPPFHESKPHHKGNQQGSS
jgi:hypothetical protein